ncbi:MAG: hypothetical protein GY699_21000 [Desulfobacteraceae bacterium]|nr:hypothetical protein [Desulfobacteraceae bacterium]
MNDTPLDFQKSKKDPSLPEIVRKEFRVPVEDKGDVWVVINKQQYPVSDICFDGISITIESKLEFTVDQSLPNCELYIFNSIFKNLNGQIIHLTARKGNIWQYGINWIEMEENTAKEISNIVTSMKVKLLKDDNILIDFE